MKKKYTHGTTVLVDWRDIVDPPLSEWADEDEIEKVLSRIPIESHATSIGYIWEDSDDYLILFRDCIDGEKKLYGAFLVIPKNAVIEIRQL